MHVAALTLWRDPGYTENSITQPKVGSSVLPAPDAIFTDLHPSRDRLFSEIKVKGDYLSLYNMSYLRLNYTITDTENNFFFAWVDTVECLSDNDQYQECLIRFHLDLWRTFKDSAVFKEGTVMRRPRSGSNPIQSCPFRFKKLGNRENLLKENDPVKITIMWLYFSYVRESSDQHVTYTSVGCIPFYNFLGTSSLYIPVGVNRIRAPSPEDIFSGSWPDKLKLDPTRIKYACISFIPPKTFTYDSHAESRVIYLNDWAGHTENDGDAFFLDDGGDATQEFSMVLSKEYMTDEKKDIIVQGYDGETVAVLPYGLPVQNYTARMVLSETACYVQLRFDGIASHSEGLCVTIPCNTLGVTENSWSSYVYSGQRDYDRRSMELQARTSAIESVTGSLGLGASLGSAKGLIAAEKTGVKGLPKTAAVGVAGAGVGAAAMGIVQAVGAGINYGVKEAWLNPEMQGLNDQLHARQTDGFILPGVGLDWIKHGSIPMIAELNVDQYSADIFDNDIAIYGIHCQEATADCQSLIEAGGPLNIIGLDVGGEIPPAAKLFMSDMFAKGVRLV